MTLVLMVLLVYLMYVCVIVCIAADTDVVVRIIVVGIVLWCC